MILTAVFIITQNMITIALLIGGSQRASLTLEQACNPSRHRKRSEILQGDCPCPDTQTYPERGHSAPGAGAHLRL